MSVFDCANDDMMVAIIRAYYPNMVSLVLVNKRFYQIARSEYEVFEKQIKGDVRRGMMTHATSQLMPGIGLPSIGFDNVWLEWASSKVMLDYEINFILGVPDRTYHMRCLSNSRGEIHTLCAPVALEALRWICILCKRFCPKLKIILNSARCTALGVLRPFGESQWYDDPDHESAEGDRVCPFGCCVAPAAM